MVLGEFLSLKLNTLFSAQVFIPVLRVTHQGGTGGEGWVSTPDYELSNIPMFARFIYQV